MELWDLETKARNIGLLGGSFNPVHLGHLMLAQNALETFNLFQVWLLPSRTAPHKRHAVQAAARHRLAMLQMAAELDLNLEVCEAEIARDEISYTADTLRRLRAQHPGARFHFIIGSDTLTELHTWKGVDDLPNLCEFVAFSRPGWEPDTLQPQDLNLPAAWAERLLNHTATGVRMEISSSDIRHRVAEGMSIRYMVPPEVEMYIYEHGLYRRGDM